MEQHKQKLIEVFLSKFKKAARESFDLVQRRVNLEAMARLELSIPACKQEVMSLSALDYSEGPEQDRSGAGTVWIFGKQIKGQEVYIKLKLIEVDGRKSAKCLSFHIADRAMSFPLKKGK